ncbi:MAG: SDR family NAD(P)-dependent oxidoreductase [Bacteroidetes bacterium]|nr:SDR family NAD(P)-dependent oxidoreductase [Bacteroidota bacterium]
MSTVAIITGTRKGLGRELCLHYLQQGFMIAGCSRGESSIDHPNYDHYSLDVSEEKKAVAMIREVYRKHGKIDVLINNAGIASMNPIPLSPASTALRILNTNYIGTFIFLREVGKIMLKKKYGRIVNFTTVATPLKLEGEALYASSKAAVETLTKIASREFASSGITVNAVGPTPIPTDLIKNVPKDKMEALLAQQAIKRFGNVDDLKNVIDFFISEKSDFITGQVIYLGGVTN